MNLQIFEIFKNFIFCTYLALNREKFNNYLTQSQSSAGGHLVYFMQPERNCSYDRDREGLHSLHLRMWII